MIPRSPTPSTRQMMALLFFSLLLFWTSSVLATCPVRLLDVPSDDDPGNGGLTLSEEGLRYLERQPSPLYVVPALGVYRGGKSLLLNRIMGLTEPYDDGFGVGHKQSTHTRGVDVCAERVEGLGTVAWMDTEGLWSSEYSRGLYGSQIFAIALLFSSAVLLNSAKVLSDQFFDFFSEEQQVARVLKRGLAEGGIPPDALLPDGLGVFWVLQQPITFNGTDAADEVDENETGCAALEEFLHRPGDERRERVHRDFEHRMHEVPMAVHDARRWDMLDQTPDDELLPEYVRSCRRLRSAILAELRDRSRPLQSDAVAARMRLFFDVVRTGEFRGDLAREAFEETEMGTLCDRFEEMVGNATGNALPVPSASLGVALIDARSDAERRVIDSAETYHLDEGWKDRLRKCVDEKETAIRGLNAEEVMMKWREAAGAASEDGSCFFLDDLAELLGEYGTTYWEDFGPTERERASEYARRLQRTRLVECVRLRDVFLPFSPLLLLAFCRMYLSDGTPSSLGTMIFHGIILLGSYSFFQMTHQLPPYLDLDYPILKESKFLLDFVMQAPPYVPWDLTGYIVRTAGIALAVWKIVKYLARMFRPAGGGRGVQQMVNLELKINELRKVSDAMIKRKIVKAAQEASAHVDGGDTRRAFRALGNGLAFACDLGDDGLMRLGVSAGFTKVVTPLLREKFVLPPRGRAMKEGLWENRLDELALRGDVRKLLGEMIRLMGLLSKR